MTSPSPAPFDTLVSSLSGDLDARGTPIEEDVQGTAGARHLGFGIDGIDNELFDRDDAGVFVDYIKQVSGLDVDLLHHEADFKSSNNGSNHTYLLGKLDGEASACWGMRVVVFIPYDTDFDPGANFFLMEDPQVIRQTLGAIQASLLEDVAQTVNDTVRAYIGGDNEKLQALFDRMREMKDGQWVDNLGAQFSRRGLESTPEAGGGKPGPRM